ncbi:hypothetical protein [Algivirga pacifica]|uniref:TonB C-terminal domain-containing protein n=1 Tax=Algivirga pacifica TaxID=1162670 RepID=A0ABP9DDR8_9BACT
MRYILLLSLISIFWTGPTLAQDSISHCLSSVDTLTNRIVFKSVDIEPQVIGGMNKLFLKIWKTLKVPKHFTPTESKIVIAFIVETTGNVTDLRTIKKIEGTNLDEQLKGIISTSKWNPGICKGEKVPTLRVLPLIVDYK